MIIPKKKKDVLPNELRKSYWAANAKDFCEKHGGLTETARLYYEAMGIKDSILMKSKLQNIMNQRAGLASSAEFVTRLLNLNTK